MSLIVDTKHRTDAEEIMDDFTINGTVLRDALDKLAHINTWLGGNKVTVNGLKSLLKDHPKQLPLTIVDLGCGGGDILRDVAKFGKRYGYDFNLIGIDANKDATTYAKELSVDYDNIRFEHCDIFSDEFKNMQFDVVLMTLFLHHFKKNQILGLMEFLLQKAKLGIVVNDLHRHRLAYYLFKLISMPIKNKMIIEDGLTSVLRGFKRKELVEKSKQLNTDAHLRWKWAFRYQWILKKQIDNQK